MYRIVKTFEEKKNIFPSHMYLYGEDENGCAEYICEIKDTTLFNPEILNNARYINSFMDNLDYVTP